MKFTRLEEIEEKILNGELVLKDVAALNVLLPLYVNDKRGDPIIMGTSLIMNLETQVDRINHMFDHPDHKEYAEFKRLDKLRDRYQTLLNCLMTVN